MKKLVSIMVLLAMSNTLMTIDSDDLNPVKIAKEAAEKARDAADAAANQAATAAKSTAEGIAKAAADAAKAAQKAADQAAAAAKNAAGNVKDEAEKIATQAKDAANQAADIAKKVGEKVGKTTVTVSKDAANLAKQFGNKFAGVVGEAIDKISACKDAAELSITTPPQIVANQVAQAALEITKNMLDNAKHAVAIGAKGLENTLKVGDLIYTVNQTILDKLKNITVNIERIYAHANIKSPKDTKFKAVATVFGKTVEVDVKPTDPVKTAKSIVHAVLESAGAVKGLPGNVTAAAA